MVPLLFRPHPNSGQINVANDRDSCFPWPSLPRMPIFLANFRNSLKLDNCFSVSKKCPNLTTNSLCKTTSKKRQRWRGRLRKKNRLRTMLVFFQSFFKECDIFWIFLLLKFELRDDFEWPQKQPAQKPFWSPPFEGRCIPRNQTMKIKDGLAFYGNHFNRGIVFSVLPRILCFKTHNDVWLRTRLVSCGLWLGVCASQHF